jgi:hypothetical protein
VNPRGTDDCQGWSTEESSGRKGSVSTGKQKSKGRKSTGRLDTSELIEGGEEGIAMTEWDRGDAEMAIALKRAELNRTLDYKSKYDAEDHNICLALICYKDGTTDVLVAYSNDSAIGSESIRLGLGLIPDVSASLSAMGRFGCSGMAQFHTEPKLLNYLCATPLLRQSVLQGPLPRNPFHRSVLEAQRKQAVRRVNLLKSPEDIASITLITEIDCCPTCTRYSIDRFRAKFPSTPLHVIELGKKVSAEAPPQYQKIKIETRE